MPGIGNLLLADDALLGIYIFTTMTTDEIEKWIHGAATIRPEREQVMAATTKSAVEDLRQIKMAGISRVMVRGSRIGKNCVACQPFIGFNILSRTHL